MDRRARWRRARACYTVTAPSGATGQLRACASRSGAEVTRDSRCTCASTTASPGSPGSSSIGVATLKRGPGRFKLAATEDAQSRPGSVSRAGCQQSHYGPPYERNARPARALGAPEGRGRAEAASAVTRRPGPLEAHWHALSSCANFELDLKRPVVCPSRAPDSEFRRGGSRTASRAVHRAPARCKVANFKLNPARVETGWYY